MLSLLQRITRVKRELRTRKLDLLNEKIHFKAFIHKHHDTPAIQDAVAHVIQVERHKILRKLC